MCPNPQETADLVTFTKEIFDEKLHFLCSVHYYLGSSNLSWCTYLIRKIYWPTSNGKCQVHLKIASLARYFFFTLLLFPYPQALYSFRTIKASWKILFNCKSRFSLQIPKNTTFSWFRKPFGHSRGVWFTQVFLFFLLFPYTKTDLILTFTNCECCEKVNVVQKSFLQRYLS